ncbi:GNAT family N-acetyltransferase [uncultured Rhodoblastus sp.]|uniref:GNAT family N-acetyltransferase n=1 Tax=uncultured Rhodoblastus sp. TaxID=543037 RepID=UPI0025F54D5E|nr:GNAT family N-acetyltransferase [uncultured Rhodoblastus sp.]
MTLAEALAGPERDELVVTLESHPDETTQIVLLSGLAAYNESRVGPDPVRQPQNHLCIAARDGDGRVRGGLQGVTIGAWLAIDLVWVEEAFRGQGAGSRLLAKAEAVAVERGCKWSILATFEFQAPEFYLARDYVEYARMEDFPAGHTRFQLRKALA